MTPYLRILLRHMFLEFFSQTDIIFCVQKYIRIYESNIFDPGSWKVDINWYIKRLSMILRPSTTSLPCTGALIPWPIVIEWLWDKTGIRYSAEAHLYCSAQPSSFYHIVLNADVNIFFFKQSNQTFDVCGIIGRILFDIIWQKRMKQCMLRTWFCGYVYFCMW